MKILQVPARHSMLAVLLSCLLLAPSLAAQAALPEISVNLPVATAWSDVSGTVHLEVNPHVIGDVFMSHVAEGELLYLLPQGCGFLCPGATPELKSYPFNIPPLPPGNYKLHFGFAADTPPLASFDLEVAQSSFEATAADPIVVLPQAPVAFAPFKVDVVTMRNNLSPDAYYATVKVRDGKIEIEYSVESDSSFVLDNNTLSTTIRGLPAGRYQLVVVRRNTDGTLVQEREVPLDIAQGPPVEQVHSLYHPDIDHYFMTANEPEKDILLDRGWRIADEGFYAWHHVWGHPENARPVCRFYSAQVNSHFYTADPKECEQLRTQNLGWQFEGFGMWIIVPEAGACPTGTVPVWRLYNNRYAQLDSNHRFVVDTETYRSMISDGWIGEGVAFCSPVSAE